MFVIMETVPQGLSRPPKQRCIYCVFTSVTLFITVANTMFRKSSLVSHLKGLKSTFPMEYDIHYSNDWPKYKSGLKIVFIIFRQNFENEIFKEILLANSHSGDVFYAFLGHWSLILHVIDRLSPKIAQNVQATFMQSAFNSTWYFYSFARPLFDMSNERLSKPSENTPRDQTDPIGPLVRCRCWCSMEKDD